MKKLLSLLGGIAIASTSASAVVACSDNGYVIDPNGQGQGMQPSHTADEAEIKASLLARAKSLIYDSEFGLSDDVTKPYAMDVKLDSFSGIADKDVAKSLKGLTVDDVYSRFFDDSSIANATGGSELNGSIGDPGGIVNKIEQDGLDAVIDKISPAWASLPDPIKNVIDSIVKSILSANGINSSIFHTPNPGKALNGMIAPIAQVLGELGTPTAMSGIYYALTLIPNLSENKGIGIVIDLVNSLLNSVNGQKDNFNKLFDPLIKDTDLSTYPAGAMKINNSSKPTAGTISSVQDQISSLLSKMIVDSKGQTSNTQNMVDDSMQLIILLGYFLTSYSYTDTPIFDGTSLASSDSKSLYDSIDSDQNVFYKTISDLDKNKTGFNIAPIVKAVSYYLGTDNSPVAGKVQRLLQMLLLQSGSSTPVLSAIGTFALTTIQQSVSADIKEADLVKVLTDKDQFNYLWSDWENDNFMLKPALDKFDILNRAFIDDNTGKPIAHNLSNLLQLPLYKFFMLAGVDGFSSNENKDSLLDTTGLLPSYAGHYTQESLVGLAHDLASMFKVDNKTKNEDLVYRFFDFTDLRDFLSEVLFSDDTNKKDSSKSFLQEMLDDLKQDNAYKIIAERLGYTKQTDGNINSDEVSGDSIVGHIIKMLVPSLKPKDTIELSDVQGASNSDNLTFFAMGLSSVLGDIMDPTVYDYWLTQMFNVNNQGMFSYTDDDPKPWDKDSAPGFKTIYFKGTNFVQSMSLNISFDFSKLGKDYSIINGMPINYSKHPKVTYNITVSRENYYGSYFHFDNIENLSK